MAEPAGRYPYTGVPMFDPEGAEALARASRLNARASIADELAAVRDGYRPGGFDHAAFDRVVRYLLEGE